MDEPCAENLANQLKIHIFSLRKTSSGQQCLFARAVGPFSVFEKPVCQGCLAMSQDKGDPRSLFVPTSAMPVRENNSDHPHPPLLAKNMTPKYAIK